MANLSSFANTYIIEESDNGTQLKKCTVSRSNFARQSVPEEYVLLAIADIVGVQPYIHRWNELFKVDANSTKNDDNIWFAIYYRLKDIMEKACGIVPQEEELGIRRRRFENFESKCFQRQENLFQYIDLTGGLVEHVDVYRIVH